jgi:hypothetical protein
LLWWTRGKHLPPLVTTGAPDDEFPGALGQPGTIVLLGDKTVDDQIRSGFQFTAGYWFESDQVLGLEASVFYLEPHGTQFTASSDGTTVLARPFVAAGSGGDDEIVQEQALVLALPGVSTGGVRVTTANRFWGAEANGRLNCCREGCCRVDLLGGFRFLELKDRLSIASVSDTIPTSGPVSVIDDFSTRNRFYGGQFGAEAEFRQGRWFLNVRGKLALGALDRAVAINGTTTFTTPDGSTVVPGGLFAQPSNIGRHSDTRFGVVPELGFRAGCHINDFLRVYAGYSVIYLARNVVQPGDQIDRTVNVEQVPALGGAAVAGDQRVPFTLKNTDWWAQGLQFGIELDF